MHIESEESGTAAAPRSGAPSPAPLLDKGNGNLPSPSSRPSWSRKQWGTRRTVLDRLRLWQSEGYQCLWVTLTSAPDSSADRLRADFQALRKRIGRELGFHTMEYVCVDTREGHGVLHMIWAWKDRIQQKRGSFYIPFEWLQPSWQSIHGAFHVNIKRIGTDDQDARRLSRYIVAQYCGGQNALVRLSQSKATIPLAAMRAELKRVLRGLPERFEFGERLRQSLGGAQYYPGTIQWVDGRKTHVPVPPDTKPYEPSEFTKAFNQFFWMAFRTAWDQLVRTRTCEAYGVTLAWVGGELRRL